MDTDLTGRIALVTGAARGIGRATALALAEQGADVALLDLAAPLAGYAQSTGTPEELAGTAADARALGRRAITVAVDVRDAEAMQTAVDRTVDELGGLGIVVANAGIAVHAPFEDHSDESWHLVLDTNILGTVHPIRRHPGAPAQPSARTPPARRRRRCSRPPRRPGPPAVVSPPGVS